MSTERVTHSLHGLPAPIPCTIHVRSDWGQVDILDRTAVIIKDPEAERNGVYNDISFNSQSVYIGERGSGKFITKDIPVLVISKASTFKFKVTHGRDQSQKDDINGLVKIELPHQDLDAGVQQNDHVENLSVFETKSLYAINATMVVETDWAELQVNNGDPATIGKNRLVDPLLYQNVQFNSDSNGARSTVIGYRPHEVAMGHVAVVPFVIYTKESVVSIRTTHGRDRDHPQDIAGTLTASFAGRQYVSYAANTNPVNPVEFRDCPLN